jgi:pimeloyl-ACP methyl ester carboxylesterase
MPVLKVPSGEIHYEEYGSGYPVLLFAPGFLSSRIERWRTNPARPGVPQDFLDPIAALSPRFRVVALDVRNAGASRVAIGPDDDWESYTSDHIALVDYLGIEKCHVMGACIGVSFAFALAQARRALVTALVLQNPIGLAGNRDAIDAEFDKWAREVDEWPHVDANLLPGLKGRLFGGDFIFSVSRQFVRECTIPILLMPGDDVMHPFEISAELAKAPRVELVTPWKGPERREYAMRRIQDFLIDHQPAN